MNKKIYVTVLVLIMSFCFSNIAFADDDDYKIIVDGEEHIIDGEFISQDGQVFVSAREFATVLGLDLKWNAETKEVSFDKVIVAKSDPNINKKIAQSFSYVTVAGSASISKYFPLEVAMSITDYKKRASFIQDNATYVDIKSFTDTLGYSYNYDKKNSTIELAFQKQTWQEAYFEFLTAQYEEPRYKDPRQKMFSLYDIDKDGVPELFDFGPEGFWEATRKIFYYDSDKGYIKCIGKFQGIPEKGRPYGVLIPNGYRHVMEYTKMTIENSEYTYVASYDMYQHNFPPDWDIEDEEENLHKEFSGYSKILSIQVNPENILKIYEF